MPSNIFLDEFVPETGEASNESWLAIIRRRMNEFEGGYDEFNFREDIAVSVENGILVGDDWELEINVARLIENNEDDIRMVLGNIAGFIRDGLDEGISPYWKLTTK